eukprot:1389339-Amorphochlora_amoeboformis.AAC.1
MGSPPVEFCAFPNRVPMTTAGSDPIPNPTTALVMIFKVQRYNLRGQSGMCGVWKLKNSRGRPEYKFGKGYLQGRMRMRDSLNLQL